MNGKIVITGALGFIGSNLVKRLIESHGISPSNIIGIDNLSSISSSKAYKYPGVEYIVNSAHVIQHIITDDVSVVFHLAAMARIQPSFINPFETLQNNINATIAVCEFARVRNCAVIHAGTSSINHGHLISPYTYTKWANEEMLKMYSNLFNVKTATCRFFNVYGPNEPAEGEYATVVRKFIRQYLNDEELTIVGDGTQSRDFTHVNDICDGLIAVHKNGELNGEIYDLGRGRPYNILELASLFPNAKLKFVSKRINEGQKTISDYELTKQKIGWSAKYNLNEYIEKFLSETK